MPLRLLLLLPAPVRERAVRRQRDLRQLGARGRHSDLRLRADVPDQHHLVQRPTHSDPTFLVRCGAASAAGTRVSTPVEGEWFRLVFGFSRWPRTGVAQATRRAPRKQGEGVRGAAPWPDGARVARAVRPRGGAPERSGDGDGGSVAGTRGRGRRWARADAGVRRARHTRGDPAVGAGERGLAGPRPVVHRVLLGAGRVLPFDLRGLAGRAGRVAVGGRAHRARGAGGAGGGRGRPAVACAA